MLKLNRKSRRNNARIMRIALRHTVRKGYDFCKVPTVVPDAPKIIDDGTMDTVVLYRGVSYRFATDYRNTFDNDGEFLLTVSDQIEDELAQ